MLWSKVMKKTNCNNCGTDFEGSFCFNCGQIYSANKRLAFSTIVRDFFDNTFNIHKGFFFTFWKLIIKPSDVATSYIQGKRKTYTNPTRYLVIALAALATMQYWTHRNWYLFYNSVFVNTYYTCYSISAIK